MSQYRKPLPNSDLEYFDTRQAVNDITPDAYDKLPYTSRILAEQLVRKVTDSTELTNALKQLINRERTLDFPWYPARVVCHDILGQTALVDLAGLRDAIAEQGGQFLPHDIRSGQPPFQPGGRAAAFGHRLARVDRLRRVARAVEQRGNRGILLRQPQHRGAPAGRAGCAVWPVRDEHA